MANVALIPPINAESLATQADPDATVIALCERGSQAIEQAATLADARDIRDWASTVEHASKVRDLNHETIILASALKIRAERRIGQLIADGQERGEIPTQGRPKKNHVDGVVSLSEVGISQQQASQAKRLAQPSDEEFAAIMDEAADEAVHRAGIGRRRVLSKIQRREHHKRESDEQAAWVKSLGTDPNPEATRLRGEVFTAIFGIRQGIEALTKVTPAEVAEALASYPPKQIHVRDQLFADLRRAAEIIPSYTEVLP